MARVRSGWVLVVVSLALSGCAGSASNPSPTSAATTAPPAVATEEFGSIAGTVVDDEQNPLGGVEVALKETSAVVMSDPAGAFVFNELAGGTYHMLTGKLGYASASRAVEVVVGEVAKVTVVLEPLALTPEPVVRMTPFQGFITCSVNWLYPANPCASAGEEKNMFRFEVDKSLKFNETVLELAWTPANAATGQELELDVCEDHASSANGLVCFESDFNLYAEGPSPVIIRTSALPVKQHPKFAVGAGAAFLQAAVQQSFWIYVTLCYNEACAEDYTAVPKP